MLARIAALVIPPAWEDVWICQPANGRIQAVGTDEAGRRQYRYHDDWRRQRDAAKHERILDFARRLPAARERARTDLAETGYSRARVMGATLTLLDVGFFRIGGEAYAEDNGSYGLATIRREHVRMHGGALVFDYPAKSGKQRVQQLSDPDLLRVVSGLRRRKDDSPELLAWKDRAGWHDVRSGDINAYLKDVFGGEVSAKDFRTWHATVLMAVALAMSREVADTPSKRKRAVARAYREVSDYLGNTPAVCRASYVDPRVIDLYDDGTTVVDAVEQAALDGGSQSSPLHGRVEVAVLEMLARPAVRQRRAA